MGERQRSLSRRESLTGCFNRRALYELFPREVERARRLGQGVALVFLDIDHFKAINDRYGHETGDRVLGERIRAAVAERPFPATEARPMVTVTVSVGVAGSSNWPIDPHALLASADAACYKAKARGRNQVSTAA